MKTTKESPSSPQSSRPKKSPSTTRSKEDGSYPQWLKTLHQREKLFRLLFERAGIGIGLADRQGNILDANPALTSMLGYSREQMKNMHIKQISHPDDLAEDLRLFDELRAGKRESYRISKRFLHRDGRVIWVELIVSCERNLDNLPLFCIGMGKDITEQKQAIDALQKSEARYRLLAENISDVIWTRDLSGKITYISSSFQKLTGISAEEAVGMSIDQIVTPASAELYKTKIAEQLELEKLGLMDPSRSWTVEVEMTHQNGSTLWTECKMIFLRDSQNVPIGTLGVTRDISERKHLEKQLIQAKKWKRWPGWRGV
jgi:PAS domain S-box-containing protein